MKDFITAFRMVLLRVRMNKAAKARHKLTAQRVQTRAKAFKAKAKHEALINAVRVSEREGQVVKPKGFVNKQEGQ